MNKENQKQVIKDYLNNSEVIQIPLCPKNRIHKFLQLVGLKKKNLNYRLRKISVLNRERMAIKALDLPDNIKNETYIIKRVFELSKDHTNALVYCAAVALQNNPEEPSNELMEALKNMDDDFIYNILEKSISLFSIETFLSSIVLLAGVQSLTSMEA